jgi:hypothetical protein
LLSTEGVCILKVKTKPEEIFGTPNLENSRCQLVHRLGISNPQKVEQNGLATLL